MSFGFETTPLTDHVVPDLATRARSPASVAAELRDAFVATGDAQDNLERLMAGALCVTSGQQPGLLTGPLYTVYKALTAVALARALEVRFSRPVVPVFWVAGDDHDFAEANHISIPGGTDGVQRIELRSRARSDPLRPLYREMVGPEIADVMTAIRTGTPDSEFRPPILTWLEAHYHPEKDLATAFAGAMADLFAPYGLVVFRSTDRAAKTAMAPYLLSAIEQASDLNRALSNRATRLEEGGLPAPVSVGNGIATVLIEDRLGRDRLVMTDGDFVTRRAGKSWTLADIHEIAREEPERLSPNVLLRPVVEAAILPTLAYVAGPGELRYLSQCDPLYDALSVARQHAVPRWSGRFIERRVAKVLAKYGIGVDDLAGPEGALEASLLAEAVPMEARSALATLGDAIEREYGRLEQSAAGIDPTLRKPIRSTKHQALAGLAETDKRIVQHLKKQNEVMVSQIARARQDLFPHGSPQERVFNVVPYLIRHGRSFVEAALNAIEAWVGEGRG